VKLLHTSDWHLGRPLYGRNRHREFEAFLDWLAGVVESEGVDLLIVSGDVFDTTTPSNRSLESYYRFLHRISRSSNLHVVVTGGNHDSPTLLEAPKALLGELNIHVVGAAAGEPGGELLTLNAANGDVLAVVCAVPYLHDRDIRTVEPGEGAEDKSRKHVEGIERHYAGVCAQADAIRNEMPNKVPLIATGHLFTAGGSVVEGDGVREIYVGSLARVGASAFPDTIDYLALGHLHVAQRVGGREHLRYSGSPIPMGFGEARQRKFVLLVEFDGRSPGVTELQVPCFQPLERLSGSLGELSARILELRAAGSSAWIEVEYRGDEPASTVQESLEEAVSGTLLEILRIRSIRQSARNPESPDEGASLEELDREAVFGRCLEARGIEESLRPGLLDCYREVLHAMDEEDTLSGEEGAS
jgi:exonuclease SbcD